ncbi:MAG: carboxylating nicotinate-nucleotide diphosphorylase [Bacteroidales bacterium]|nr:carboxylating nicotinate-nucleotide diphosphorylase [Bacteroidales bacterium]
MNSIHDLDSAIDRWLREDIGDGDHTTYSTIPFDITGSAKLLVKEAGILAGVMVAERIFHRFDEELHLDLLMEDGVPIDIGNVVLRVSGKVHSILQCERLVLNVMQRMSGIATNTRSYVKLLEGTGTRILDTRKTTPGIRLLEKVAVRLGGGMNHRFGLHDMILIKDNHVDFVGGIVEAIRGTQAYLVEKKLDLEIVVETRNLKDIKKVLAIGGIRRILLDNFSLEQTRQAVKLIDKRVETESSGGITKKTIRSYAECGVDYISVGALTHQINSLDLSLKADFG